MNDPATAIALIATACFSLIFITYNFMERLFIRAYRSRALYIGAFLVSWLLMIAANLMFSGVISMVTSVTIVLVAGFWLYGVRRSSDLLALLLFYMFLLLTEIIGQIAVSMITGDSFAIMPGNLLQSLITFLCYQIMMFFLTRKRQPFHQPGLMGVLLVIPALSLVLLYILMALLPAGAGPAQLALSGWGTLLVFAINLLVYFLASRMAAVSAEKQQLAVMEQQRQIQYRNYRELAGKSDESRRLYHDLKNHVLALEQLYGSSRSQASVYGAELLQKLSDQQADWAVTGNRVLDGLLRSAGERAAAMGIPFRCAVEECDLGFLSDFDLTTILANLLDNAFEGCGRDGWVELHLACIHNFTVLGVSNPAAQPPALQGGVYLSRKEGHMGVGLANVKRAAAAYDGTVLVDYADGIFAVQVTFPGRDR